MDLPAIPISLLSLVVSIAALLLNQYRWHEDGARLRIETKTIRVKEGGAYRDALSIMVMNAGRLKTEVNHIDFPVKSKLGVGGGALTSLPSALDSKMKIPHELSPGALAKFEASNDYLILLVLWNRVDPRKLRLRVRTGHKDFVTRLPKDLIAGLERQLKEREAKQDGEAPRGKS